MREADKKRLIIYIIGAMLAIIAIVLMSITMYQFLVNYS